MTFQLFIIIRSFFPRKMRVVGVIVSLSLHGEPSKKFEKPDFAWLLLLLSSDLLAPLAKWLVEPSPHVHDHSEASSVCKSQCHDRKLSEWAMCSKTTHNANIKRVINVTCIYLAPFLPENFQKCFHFFISLHLTKPLSGRSNMESSAFVAACAFKKSSPSRLLPPF